MSKSCDLIASVKPRVGRNVSHSHTKTRRRFIPNIQNISFLSDLLGIKIKLRIASSTIRTIAKHGSLDNFILNIKRNKLTDFGLKLRKKLNKRLSENTSHVAKSNENVIS